MFKKYLKEYSNRLIPPVILSARGKWEFQALDESNEIGSLKINGKAAIIDGQHRIGGIVSHNEDTGEILGLSVNPSSTPNDVNITCVWEFDFTD